MCTNLNDYYAKYVYNNAKVFPINQPYFNKENDAQNLSKTNVTQNGIAFFRLILKFASEVELETDIIVLRNLLRSMYQINIILIILHNIMRVSQEEDKHNYLIDFVALQLFNNKVNSIVKRQLF